MIAPGQILVTGGEGRLGRALGRLGMRTLGRSGLNILDADSIAKALTAHAPLMVINTAAYTAVDRAETEERAAFAINETGAKLLAQACNARRLPLIHISTDCVFGDGDPARPVSETDPTHPLSVYGRSKLAGEQAVLAAGGPVCIARVAWLFEEAPGTFVEKMLSLAQTRDALSVVNDAHGRPVPVADLAIWLLKLSEKMSAGAPLPDVLHLGPPLPVSRFEWAAEIFKASRELDGPSPELTACSSDHFSEPARRPRGLVLDVARADALLGQMPDWRPACTATVRAILDRK